MVSEAPSAAQLAKGKLIGSRSPLGTPVAGGDEELNRFTRLQNVVFSEYHRALALDNKFYHLDFDMEIIPKEWRDDGFKAVKPNTAHMSVESAAEHILTTPKIHVPVMPVSEGDFDAALVADKKQQALKFFWHNVFLAGDPLGEGKKNIVKDGRMVLRVDLRWDLVDPDAAVYGKNEFPWRVRLRSNETILEDTDNPYDPSYIFESFQIRTSDAKRYYPDAAGDWGEKKQPTDTVRLVEYFCKPSDEEPKGKRIVWIENERVIDTVNPYHYLCGVTETGEDKYDGWVPYAIAPSGWGSVDATNMPHERYAGILRHMHSVLIAEAEQATMAQAQLKVATFPPVKVFGQMAVDKDHPFRFGPAAVLPFPQGKNENDAEVMAYPNLPAGVIDMLNRTHMWANEVSRFNTLSGGAQRGVDTATEADLNVRNASARLSGPIAGLTGMIARVNTMMLKCIELILEAPVILYGATDGMSGAVTLSPEEIDGFYMSFVALQTTEQAALDRALLKTWGDAFNGFQTIDPEYAMRQAGIENPKERIEKMLDHQVLMDPMMHQARVAMKMSQLPPEVLSTMQLMRTIAEVGEGQQAAPPTPGGGLPANQQTGAAAEAAVVTDARNEAMTARPDLLMQ